jgi:hypothetical protein
MPLRLFFAASLPKVTVKGFCCRTAERGWLSQRKSERSWGQSGNRLQSALVERNVAHGWEWHGSPMVPCEPLGAPGKVAQISSNPSAAFKYPFVPGPAFRVDLFCPHPTKGIERI